VTFFSDTHLNKTVGGEYTPEDPQYERRWMFESFRDYIAANPPDFYVDCGDDLFGGALPHTIYEAMTAMENQADCDSFYSKLRDVFNPFLSVRGFYYVSGNHDLRCGYKMDPDDLHPGHYYERWATIAQKRYFANPDDGENDPTLAWIGDATGEKVGGQDEGNTTPLENYWTFVHGAAQFFFITPFRYTGINDDWPNDRADWTLGDIQLNWLLSELAASTARWKIVICHQLPGSCADNAYGRLGTADIELPGHYMSEIDGGPGLHYRFVEYGVNMVIKGHDHLNAYGVVDGVTYVTISSPDNLPVPYADPENPVEYGYENSVYAKEEYGYFQLAYDDNSLNGTLYRIEYDGNLDIGAMVPIPLEIPTMREGTSTAQSMLGLDMVRGAYVNPNPHPGIVGGPGSGRERDDFIAAKIDNPSGPQPTFDWDEGRGE